MRYFALIFIVAISISGCASVQMAPPKYEQGNFPALNQLTTVHVGNVMVSQWDYLSSARATLMREVRGSFWSGRNAIAAGESLVPAISQGERVFCRPPLSTGAPCLKDTNKDGHFDVAYTYNPFGMLEGEAKIEPVLYRLADMAIQDGFKYELLYQGVDRGVVRIAYREYTENLARPAFSQDLTYTLEPIDTRMRFRDVSATIHHADNNQITYTVHSGF